MAERPVSQKPVLQKLLLKPGMRAAVLNAPSSYQTILQDAPRDVDLHQRIDAGHFDFIHYFATQREELLREGPRLRETLKPNGILWVSYPKGKAVATDLNRDVVRITLAEVRLEVFSQVAIDDVWSALRARPM